MEKKMMTKIKISWKTKAIYLLAAGHTSIYMNEATAMDLLRRTAITEHQKGCITPEKFKEVSSRIGIDATPFLFPKHWDAFFKYCDPLDYAGTLNAMTAFAQGILQQPFVMQVKADLGVAGNNIVVAGGNLSVWIEAAQAEAFRDKLKIWPEHQKKFNKYKAAAKVHETLNGLDGHACIPTFNFIAASQNCDQPIKEAYTQHLANLPPYKNTSITNAVVAKVIDGGQPRADAERDAKIDVECQILTNLGIPQNHIQAVARDIVVNNTPSATALTNQLNPIIIGGQDITANVAQKVIQNNINFGQLTQAAERVHAALAGANNAACVQVFKLIAGSPNCAKTVNDAFKEHVGNVNYKNASITDAIVTKVINGKQPRAEAERDAKIDVECQILTNLGVSQIHAQAAAQNIVANIAPVTALSNQLTPVMVDGQDIKADVAQRVIQGTPLTQATKDAKILKHTQILKAKAYGFDDETCELLAIELEKGRTLQQACQEKLHAILCAGQDIKTLVIQEMISHGKTFDKAYEKVAIETHFANLKQHNTNKGLGLQEIVLQQVADKVGKRQFKTYQEALVASSAPIMFACEGQNINITKDVLGLVYEGDMPKLSLTNATNQVKISTLKGEYIKKNLGLHEQECLTIASNIILHNDAPFDAIVKSLPRLEHRNTPLVKVVAQKIAANMHKDTAIHEAKVAVDVDFFTTLNIGLTVQQVKEIAERSAKGIGDGEALSHSITRVQCEGTDLTVLVANSMISNKENYDTAAKKLKINHYKGQIRTKTKDLAENTIALAATQFVEGGAPSLAQALAKQIPASSYEGKDLGLAVATRMLQKVSLVDATKTIWIDAASRDITTNHSKLAEQAQILAQDMFARQYTKQKALETYLKTQPLFANVQGKIADVAHKLLTSDVTIDNAWHEVCLQPKIQELQLKYAQFENDAVIFMATSCVKEGTSEIQSLRQYLLSINAPQGNYCPDTNTIADLMIQNKESYKDTLQKAERQIVHDLLTTNGGWGCLVEGGELLKLVNLCLTQDTIEEGEAAYLFSVCQNIPGDLLPIFLKQVKYATDKFEKVQNSFLITTVIPTRIKEAHPNLVHPKVLEYIAKKLVDTKKVNDPLSPDLLKDALRSAPILPNASNGLPYPPNFVEEVAKKLLNDTKLSPDEALTAVHVDHQAKHLQNKYNHLSVHDLQALAKLFIHHDLEGEVLKQVIATQFTDNGEHVPLEIAQKLLKNGDLSVEDALDAVQVDRKSAYLKLNYNHLDVEDCEALAKVFVENSFESPQSQTAHIQNLVAKEQMEKQILKSQMQKAIALVLRDKNFDVNEIDNMLQAILTGSTFKAAEDYYSYRKFIDEERGITDEYARQIAELKRQNNFTRDEQAFEKFFQMEFNLSPEQAQNCCNFYSADEEMTLKGAVKKTKFVYKTQDALKNKNFYHEDKPRPYEIWDIAVKSFDRNKNVSLGLRDFLCESRLQSTPFAFLPCSDLILQIIGKGYFSLMAEAIWENDASIGGFLASQMTAFEDFQTGYVKENRERLYGILEMASVYISQSDIRTMQKNQQQQCWTNVFGDYTQSLPAISAIMMYKFGITLTEIQSPQNFDKLKNGLQKVVPVYLQHVYPDAAQQNLSCLQYIVIDEHDLNGKKEARELCKGYYQAISNKMVKEKKNYQTTSQEIQRSIQTKRNQIKSNLFNYLEDTHAQEIAEAEFYVQKDRKEQAIFRYIKDNIHTVSPFIMVFGKKVEDLLDDKEKYSYLFEFSQILSLKTTGESFQDACREYQDRLETVARKLEAKSKEKIPFLNLQNYRNMVFEVKMLKKSPDTVLSNILKEIDMPLPAIMLEKEYLSDYIASEYSGERKRMVALNNIVRTVGLTIEDEKAPLFWKEAIQEELSSCFRELYSDTEEQPLYLPIINPLSTHLAKFISQDNVLVLAYDKQMQLLNQEKVKGIELFLNQCRILEHNEQNLLQAVSGQMATSSTHYLYALLEAKAARLSNTQQLGDLYKARLQILKQQGIIEGNIDQTTINIAVGFHDAIKEILPKATDLEVTLAAYHHAKMHRDHDPQEATLLKGLQPLHTANCVKNLQIIGVKDSDFSCPNFNFQRDLSKVAASKSLNNPDFNIFLHDGKTIGCLYRRDNNIIPTCVIEFDKEIINAHMAKKRVLMQDWEALLQRNKEVNDIVKAYSELRQQAVQGRINWDRVNNQVRQWNQTLQQQMGLHPLDDLYWDKHFDNTPLLESVSMAVTSFGQIQQGKIKINLETLKYDPWYKATSYDRMDKITIHIYDGLKNRICDAVTRYCDQANIMNKDSKCRGISRFFSWGQTSDMQRYLGYFKPFSGQQLELWRKRVKYACDNVIFANPCTDKEIYERVASLYTPEILGACSNPAQDALCLWEQQLPASEELTLFNKLANCLSDWKLGEIDCLVKKNYKGAKNLETECGRFMRLVCKKPLSIFTNDTTMDHFSYLHIYTDQNNLDHGNGLSIKPFVHEFLKCYQNEVVIFIKDNISFKKKPINDGTCQIYFEEILSWAPTYKKYCNLQGEELRGELSIKNGKDIEINETAVMHLLSHAGYIDWEDKDK